MEKYKGIDRQTDRQTEKERQTGRQTDRQSLQETKLLLPFWRRKNPSTQRINTKELISARKTSHKYNSKDPQRLRNTHVAFV